MRDESSRSAGRTCGISKYPLEAGCTAGTRREGSGCWKEILADPTERRLLIKPADYICVFSASTLAEPMLRPASLSKICGCLTIGKSAQRESGTNPPVTNHTILAQSRHPALCEVPRPQWHDELEMLLVLE